MRVTFIVVAATLMLNAEASANCTQQDATQMMQKILASPEYIDAVGKAGTTEGTSAARTATKSGLRRFGGALGGIGADVLKEEDNSNARNQANESATAVKQISTRMNDAGEALGRSDVDTACLLYKQVMDDLGMKQGN